MIPNRYPQKLPQAVLFDWDNTLVDTWLTVFEAINTALTAVDKPRMTEAEYWNKPHLSMRDSAADLFGHHWARGIEVFYEHVEKFHLETIHVLEGAEILLHDLTNRGIYTGVVSNKDGRYLRKEVAHLGWDAHFKRVVGARDTKEDKPSSIPVLAALEDSRILPSHDVWFVGDSIVDVKCARESGCVPIVVGSGEASLQDDIVHVKDCAGLRELLAVLG